MSIRLADSEIIEGSGKRAHVTCLLVKFQTPAKEVTVTFPRIQAKVPILFLFYCQKTENMMSVGDLLSAIDY